MHFLEHLVYEDVEQKLFKDKKDLICENLCKNNILVVLLKGRFAASEAYII